MVAVPSIWTKAPKKPSFMTQADTRGSRRRLRILYTVSRLLTTAKPSSTPMVTGESWGRPSRRRVAGVGARRVLEIGMFTGYSALSMAAGLPPDGHIVTCDVDPKAEAIARRHIEASPFADRIEIRMGPALDTIASLEGPFDFVFI